MAARDPKVVGRQEVVIREDPIEEIRKHPHSLLALDLSRRGGKSAPTSLLEWLEYVGDAEKDEIEAAMRYRELATHAREQGSEEMAKVLEEIASDEDDHREKLKEWYTYFWETMRKRTEP